MRIGVLGGTFNPIHVAHVYLAERYYEKLGLERLIFIPASIPPHKSAEHVIGANERLEMCELAVKDYPEFEVSDYEIMRSGKSYTYLTLEHLKEQYPDSNLFLLMGADMFLTVQDWANPDKIFELAVLCAAERDFGESNALEAHAGVLGAMGARCKVLHIEPLPLSSTEIREKIAKKSDVTGLLNPNVWQYIKEHKLYGV